jgi:hypothetical protein
MIPGGSGPPWPPARRAYAWESATRCGYVIVFTFYGLGFSTLDLDMAGLGQGFKSSKVTFDGFGFQY